MTGGLDWRSYDGGFNWWRSGRHDSWARDHCLGSRLSKSSSNTRSSSRSGSWMAIKAKIKTSRHGATTGADPSLSYIKLTGL
jgi:hypothetical protein